MRLLIVTDAWSPQTNGVVTTLANVIGELEADGHEVHVIEPGGFRTLPLPGYAEIRIVREPWRVGERIEEVAPDTVHVATEGPLGLAARRYLVRRGRAFTTSLHTKFPEYVADRIGLSPRFGYRFMRWFHGAAERTLVTTPSHRDELAAKGFRNLVVWGRGVDTRRFRPSRREPRRRPRLLYAGRVSVEKNVSAFLELEVDADKVVVGDGPACASLRRRFPGPAWLGYRYGDELVAQYADADAFVFPSLTDTFGLVMLEAMACGTPVAAFPVTGPADVVREGVNGALDDDLAGAVARALEVPRDSCRRYALDNNWAAVARRMAQSMTPAG